MNNALKALPRDEAAGDTVPGGLLDLAWEPAVPGRRRVVKSWREYMVVASQVVGRFHQEFRIGHFDYLHPMRLQSGTPRRLRRPYHVPVSYAEWGPADAPVLLCCGGVASVAMRFNYLASDLSDRFRVICMDWVGRGRSGWLAAEGDYSLSTYAEQLRQMIVHLGPKPVTVLGSSLGGSAAIEMTARNPKLVERLILNDVGPHIPARRRRRRAETLARHYVFREPSDLLRRVGASQKNDGPVSDDIRFNLTFHQTRWSDEDGGGIVKPDGTTTDAIGPEGPVGPTGATGPAGATGPTGGVSAPRARRSRSRRSCSVSGLNETTPSERPLASSAPSK